MAASPPIDTLQAVELADGVEIQLRVAGPAARSVAWLIDLLIFGALLAALGIGLLLAAASLGRNTALGLFLLAAFVLSWFYNVLFEMTARAATPGQRVMGLKVASVAGTPVRLPQSIIRNLLRVIDFMPACYLFGLACSLFNQRFQRLGDLVADTVVVYAGTEAAKTPPAQVHAEAVAPQAILSRIEQSAIQQFLERAPQWSDARKMELTDLLEPLTGRSGMAGLHRTCGIGLWLQNRGNGKP